MDSTQWQTTLLLNSPVGEKCPIRAEFALQTSARDSPYRPIERKGALAQTRYCRRITLTFRGPAKIPVSADLVLRAPGGAISSVPASFTRPVGMGLYFAVPAGIGAGMLIALFGFAMIFVKVYDRAGAVLRPWRSREGTVGWNGEFWRWTVMASGAWTVGDSWATNIATVTAIVGTLLTTTGAASTIFPGIALDRFAFVNMLVAGLIAAVPLVFAILYSRWTARFPGPTLDATIAPHVELPEGCEVSLGEDLAVTFLNGTRDRRTLVRGTAIRLRRKTFGIVTDGSPVLVAPEPVPHPGQHPAPNATLASGTVIAPVRGERDDVARAIRAHSPLGTNTQVQLAQTAVLSPGESRWAWIRSGQRATIVAGLPGAPGVPALAAETQVRLPAGAVATFAAAVTATASPAGRAAALPSGTKVSPAQPGAIPEGTKITIRGHCPITLIGQSAAGARRGRAGAAGGRRGRGRRGRGRRGRPAVPGQNPAITVPAWTKVPVTAPAGATITLPGGAALGAIDDPDQWPVQAKDGTTVQAPPGSIIEILAGRLIAVPGGSDLLVGGETAMKITSPGNLTTVPAGSVAPAPKPPPGPHAAPGRPAAPGRVARMLARRGHRGRAGRSRRQAGIRPTYRCPARCSSPHRPAPRSRWPARRTWNCPPAWP